MTINAVRFIILVSQQLEIQCQLPLFPCSSILAIGHATILTTHHNKFVVNFYSQHIADIKEIKYKYNISFVCVLITKSGSNTNASYCVVKGRFIYNNRPRAKPDAHRVF